MPVNKYGSKNESAVGMDMYNLANVLSPPTDLSIASTHFTNRYLAVRQGASGPTIRFNKTDQIKMKRFGFFSNFADGLVDASAAHQLSGNTGFTFTLSVDRLGAVLPGTMTDTGAGTNIFNTTQDWRNYLVAGMTVVFADDGGNLHVDTVSAVSATQLTLTNNLPTVGMFAGASGRVTADAVYPLIVAPTTLAFTLAAMNFMQDGEFVLHTVDKIRPFTGKWTFTEGSDVVRGERTKFTEQVTAGQYVRWFDSTSTLKTGKVSSVDSDTQLTLDAVVPVGASGTYDADNAGSIGTSLDVAQAIRVQLSSTISCYTISIDPAYANKRLMFHFIADIEHSLDASGALAG